MDDRNRSPAQSVLDGAGILFFVVTALLGRASPILLLTILFLEAGAEWLARFRRQRVVPYPFFLLMPLLLIRYSSVTDFQFRLVALWLLVHVVALAFAETPGFIRKVSGSLTGGRVWAIALLVNLLCAWLFYARGIYLSGDEPHYVLIAQSLAEDGDIDLKNNLEGKTYNRFHPVDLDFHGSVRGERWVPFHMPGLAVLLIPFYWLHMIFTGFPPHLLFRLAAALLQSLLAVGLFQVMRATFPDKPHGKLLLFFIVTPPLLIHSIHLYPELPAGLLLLFAYLWSIRQQRRFFWSGLFLAAIPWFHIKYAPAVAVLALWMFGRLILSKRYRQVLQALLPLFVGAAGLLIYSRVLYGSFNPGIIFPSADYFSVSHWRRLETGLAFFLDQRDGLLLFAPASLFFFFGWLRRFPGRLGLGLTFLAYTGFHAFTTVRGAYSPAGRPLMVVYWIIVLAVASWHTQSASSGSRTVFRFAAGMTLFMLVWIAFHPLFVYQPVTGTTQDRSAAVLQFLGSTSLPLTTAFPSFLKADNRGYAANYIWLGLLLAGLILAAWRKPWRIPERAVPVVAWGLLGIGLFLFCFHPRVHLSRSRRVEVPGAAIFINSRNFSPAGNPGGFRVLAGPDYDLFLDLPGSTAPLRLDCLAPAGVELRLRSGVRTLMQTGEGDGTLRIDPARLHALTVGGRRVAHLGFETHSDRPRQYLSLRICEE